MSNPPGPCEARETDTWKDSLQGRAARGAAYSPAPLQAPPHRMSVGSEGKCPFSEPRGPPVRACVCVKILVHLEPYVSCREVARVASAHRLAPH